MPSIPDQISSDGDGLSVPDIKNAWRMKQNRTKIKAFSKRQKRNGRKRQRKWKNSIRNFHFKSQNYFNNCFSSLLAVHCNQLYINICQVLIYWFKYVMKKIAPGTCNHNKNANHDAFHEESEKMEYMSSFRI